ncbi:hypothetical protein MATL_G00101010 [Megalops atlanticus]|uniref:Uncharacterized protein n=1 Tax=Megalops atlanticus TaxID=7932 RepID=A0A9D3TF00_MEGAT|nr:hypothetical protein MATL_G00101010 [Megalops atlanticus]
MVVISAKPKQYTVADGVRSNQYKAVQGELLEQDVLKVEEAFKDITADLAPLIITMGIREDVPLVDSALGAVQQGSPISYQCPVPVSRVVVRHADTPTPLPLPLDGYRLDPTTCQFVLSHQQQHHLSSLSVSWDVARKVEMATREQSDSVEWHRLRKSRLTSSRFREICHVRGHSSVENLAERIRKGVGQTARMKRGLALEPFMNIAD